MPSFVYTVCGALGFTWQQALSMVFVCGLFNILITVTKIRKYIIKAIPRSLQNAIGGRHRHLCGLHRHPECGPHQL